MKIKYMGSSDARKISKGETFGGQLADEAALDRDIVWSWDNNHVIDTDDYEGTNDAFWELLLDYSADPSGPKEFKDVTDAVRVPTNEAQQIWRGMKKTEPEQKGAAAASDDDTDDGEGARNASGTAETDETDPDAGGGVSEASGTAGADTTAGVGGSTSGRPGPGGSTKGRSKS